MKELVKVIRNMRLQEQISRIQSINETMFFRRRVKPSEVASNFIVYAQPVFYETVTYKQFKYELTLKALEGVMWDNYKLGYDDLPEQQEIDFINQITEMYSDMIEAIYNNMLERERD
jgi:hypothetical protein